MVGKKGNIIVLRGSGRHVDCRTLFFLFNKLSGFACEINKYFISNLFVNNVSLYFRVNIFYSSEKGSTFVRFSFLKQGKYQNGI